jgi:DNA-binding NtrC family response regulator
VHSPPALPNSATGLGLSVPPDAIILLLDSEPVMRAALHDALVNAGYLVVTAGELGEALDRLAETPADLLITRPYINSMPGRIAADYLRRRQNGLPVLVVAGFLEDDRVGVQNEVEEFHTFPKPFRRDELVAKVKDVLNLVRRKA